jgi:hypothetical protein
MGFACVHYGKFAVGSEMYERTPANLPARVAGYARVLFPLLFLPTNKRIEAPKDFSAGGRIAVYYNTSTFSHKNIYAYSSQIPVGAAPNAPAGTIYIEENGTYPPSPLPLPSHSRSRSLSSLPLSFRSCFHSSFLDLFSSSVSFQFLVAEDTGRSDLMVEE